MSGLKILIALVLTAMSGISGMAADILEGYSTRREVIDRMIKLPLVDIEGIWLFPASGETIVVEREDPDAMRFRIVSLGSQWKGFESGTLLGYAVPTAKTSVFDASLGEINSDGSRRGSAVTKFSTARFTFTLASGRMSIVPVHRGLRVNWWRLFPYMFRFSVRSYDDRPKDLDGCMKIWPRDPAVPPYQPRYL